jgi:hypothetical protein
MSAFMDIGQGAGLATAGGVRPLIPPIVAGVLAKADAGIDLEGTDFSWMESPIFFAALIVIFIGYWLADRRKTGDAVRSEPPWGDSAQQSGYIVLAMAAGALTFAASLAAGGESTVAGLSGGIVCGVLGYYGFTRLFEGANRRLAARGDTGVLLGLVRDAIAVATSAAVIALDVLGFLVVIVALLLLFGASRAGGEKYEGLRVLR